MVAVLASGCRSLLSAETPSALEQSGSESWAHFQTAMDLVSHLLYKPASLAVVEVIISVAGLILPLLTLLGRHFLSW